MDTATLSAYKQEFFEYALTYKELVGIPFAQSPVAGQKIVGVKLETVEYLGRLDEENKFKVRDDLIELLTEHGYSSDSVVIDISLGYDESCTCDMPDCHNVYSSFSCKSTAAGLYLRDTVSEIIRAGAFDAPLGAVIDEWLLVPLLTTKHINATTVFVVIPALADESHYSSIITI